MAKQGRTKYESYKNYSEYGGFEMLLLNTHDNTSDIVTTLFCHEKLQTPHTCNAIMNDTNNRSIGERQNEEDETEEETLDDWIPRSNHVQDKETTAYDEIAKAAYRQGILSVVGEHTLHYKLTRAETRTAIQIYHQQELKLTEEDLPRICLEDGHIEQMERLSMEYEEELFPSFFSSAQGKASLQSKIAEYKRQGRFCAVDTDALLLDRLSVILVNLVSRGY